MDVVLPRSRDAGERARRLMAERFREQLGEQPMATLQTVVSELVNNAVVHGQGTITLRAALSGDCVRVEVTDEGRGKVPAIRERAEFESGGWGLQIVKALSARWGAYEGTTHVWADVRAA